MKNNTDKGFRFSDELRGVRAPPDIMPRTSGAYSTCPQYVQEQFITKETFFHLMSQMIDKVFNF